MKRVLHFLEVALYWAGTGCFLLLRLKIAMFVLMAASKAAVNI